MKEDTVNVSIEKRNWDINAIFVVKGNCLATASYVALRPEKIFKDPLQNRLTNCYG